MKKFYMFLAAAAAMTMSAQAQNLNYGAIEVGDFETPTEFYNGSYFDMAPTNFYLAHTGVQMIYGADEIGQMNGMTDVMINKLSFKFNSNGAWETIYRDVKVYLEETDATQFAVVEGVKQFFTFDHPVLETSVEYDMVEFFGEDKVMEFDLGETPFALSAGKNLLVTIVFDAIDDDNCTIGSDYAPFYTSGIRGGKAMLYTDNWTSFIEYAQGEDFPDATSMLGCGTNVELPVTLFNYSYAGSSSISEVTVGKSGDDAYYNLMGQKFSAGNLPAGIYIHNGKKVMVK